MPAVPKWSTEVFENSLDGVSSAVTPELIQATQLAWGKNIINRGAKPGTRPSFKRLLTLPSGLVQGVSYFGVQGGMGVVSIGGHIYRIRIGVNDASFEEILLPWWNSGIVKQVYMQQTVETLVIQDGQSNPILYDGSTAERSDPSTNGVPLGRQMAYGNGRLWVAINGKELVAGDIRTNVIGSELSFTETNYLSGGGTFFFPRGITGLNFIATTGTSDYGALLVFGSDYCDSLRADITFRDLWAQTPGFITSVLRHTGCSSHWSLGQVNQDLYWRDAAGGIRSIRSSLADESGSGNAPISREVSRLTDYDSPQLLNFCSSISFNNRLLVTSSPRLNEVGGITWENLIALDFAPVSTMRGKSMPAYDGQWQGINFTHLFQGQFNNKSRAFAISHDDGGSNSLWEIMPDGRGPIDDETISSCTDGTGVPDLSPITCTIEHGRRVFGNPTIRKRLERCDVYLWGMQGDIGLRVYWRTDNNQKWQQWDEVEVCAKNGDPEDLTETVHVWKNLLPQQRPQIKSFTIPSTIDPITKYSLITGFEFQIRLVWTGRTKIYKTVLHSTFLDDSPFAMRDVLESACLDNDVTGNEIIYNIPSSPCPFLFITQNPENVRVDGTEFLIITENPVSVAVSIGEAPLEYRKRSGDPALIGNDEFTDPSTPPKRYRRRTLSGTAWWCHNADEFACNPTGPLPDSTAATINGFCEYDRLTTILDNQSDYGEALGSCMATPSTGSQLGPTCFYPPQSVWGISGGNYTETLLQTTQVYAGNNICASIAGGWLTATGNLTYSLSVEDLEEDAIDRFRLNIGWGSWSGSQWTADYEARTSGFAFHYQESQFRVNLTGLTPGATVVVDGHILRRVHDTGSFLPFGTVSFTTIADGGGGVAFEAYTPNERGFDSVVLTANYLQYV